MKRNTNEKEDKIMLIIIVYGGLVITGAVIISASLKVLELADKEIKSIKEKA